MAQKLTNILLACCAVASAAAALPRAVASVAPAFMTATPTPPAFPTYPVSYEVFLPDNNIQAVGTGGGGPLGVTSLTFANYSGVTQQVYAYAVSTTGPGCTGNFVASAGVQHDFLLQPQQSLHIPFPTPFMVTKVGTVHCLGIQVATDLSGGSVGVLVNGYHQ